MSEGAPEAGAHAHGHGLDLNAKIGPLPLKVWLVAVGGVVVVAWYLRRRDHSTVAGGNAGAATPPTAIDNTQPGAGNLAGSTPGYIDTTGNGAQLGAGLTNPQWLTKAENALLGSGADAYTVDQALQAYLTGQQLTPAQEALFNQAVQQVGPVPNPVPAMPGSGGAGIGGGGAGGSGGTGGPPSSSAPAWNPADTPWATLVKGVFTDRLTGRGAFYGPNGEPGSATRTSKYNAAYTMPDGRTAYYAPGDFTYANGTVNTAGEQHYEQTQANPTPTGPGGAPLRLMPLTGGLPTTAPGGKYQAGG